MEGVFLTTSNGSVVTEQGTVNTQPNGVITIRNDGPVAVVITLHTADGALVSEVGALNPSNENYTNTAGVGTYQIRVRESGTPLSSAQACGTYVVHAQPGG